MNIGADFLFLSIWGILIMAALLALIRLIKGPHLPDRVMALDMISMLLAGAVLVHSVLAGEAVYLDVVVIISLVIFFATVSFALYIQRRAQS
ncbi:MAG: pesticidal protein Cry22Aa [Acidobacteria bacterium]|nr:pesticidal protein Cry22Aa [Acidobacteriota bacterium]